MASDSIMARPMNSVRLMRSARSGWRAMASSAESTDRPWASAVPIDPIATANPATTIDTTASMVCVSKIFSSFLRPDGGGQVHGREYRENIRLHDPSQYRQHHDRHRHQQARDRQQDGDDEFLTDDVPEQAHR